MTSTLIMMRCWTMRMKKKKNLGEGNEMQRCVHEGRNNRPTVALDEAGRIP
jgi:hypothetical protein